MVLGRSNNGSGKGRLVWWEWQQGFRGPGRQRGMIEPFAIEMLFRKLHVPPLMALCFGGFLTFGVAVLVQVIE